MAVFTGKYAAEPAQGRRTFGASMEVVDEVVAVLRRVGEAHDGRTPSQVALNWLIAKGAVPIPGAKPGPGPRNAGGLGWSLTPAEVAELRPAPPWSASVGSPGSRPASGNTADVWQPG